MEIKSAAERAKKLLSQTVCWGTLRGGSQIVSFTKIGGEEAKNVLSQTSQGRIKRRKEWPTSYFHKHRGGNKTRGERAKKLLLKTVRGGTTGGGSQIVSFATIVGGSSQKVTCTNIVGEGKTSKGVANKLRSQTSEWK